ncbi:hypothetical protein [Halalkalicoccus salilacus]|uniref:hypothetical protein n=1 Tax=Halalkalicoccus TaxID=332246 RepID=UPI002F96367A
MDDDPTDRDPEPFGARPGESERSDSSQDDNTGEIAADDEGWGSEIAIALGLVGGVLLLAGLLFVGLGGLGTDGGDGGGAAPANTTNTTNTTNATDAPNATNETEDPEDVQEDGVENDTEPAPTDEPETEPEPNPGPEPNETEPNETEPQNETEPGNETGNETNETEPQPGATAVIRVVDGAGAPVEGEPVTLIAMDGSESTHTTDENGEVVIELAAGDPSDVARFDVRVRDQEQTVYIQRDDVHGVQMLVFEVGESDPAGNETNETGNESAVAATIWLSA